MADIADTGETADASANVTVMHTWLIPVVALAILWILGTFVFKNVRV